MSGSGSSTTLDYFSASIARPLSCASVRRCAINAMTCTIGSLLFAWVRSRLLAKVRVTQSARCSYGAKSPGARPEGFERMNIPSFP